VLPWRLARRLPKPSTMRAGRFSKRACAKPDRNLRFGPSRRRLCPARKRDQPAARHGGSARVGAIVAFPAFHNPAKPFQFRAGDPRPGTVRDHAAQSRPLPVVEPDLVLVPLIAVDPARCAPRPGKGHYDRVLAQDETLGGQADRGRLANAAARGPHSGRPVGRSTRRVRKSGRSGMVQSFRARSLNGRIIRLYHQAFHDESTSLSSPSVAQSSAQGRRAERVRARRSDGGRGVGLVEPAPWRNRTPVRPTNGAGGRPCSCATSRRPTPRASTADSPHRRTQSGGKPFSIASRSIRRPAQALECLTSAILLRSRKRERRRPAVGRSGRAQPSAPSGIPLDGLRGGLPGLDPGHRLPVHLHQRRIAPAPPRRRAGRARAGSPRPRLTERCSPGRPRDPLSCQLRGPLLGLEPGQECRRRRPSFLSLGRRMGAARSLHPGLCPPANPVPQR
jgi:hypothetical protein